MILKNIMEKLKIVLSLVLALTGRPILFHAIMENGAIFYRLPISAFIQKGFDLDRVPRRRLDELQLWNCFSYYPSVHCWDILDGQSGKYIGKDKKWHSGKYLFTVDFAHPESVILDTDHSEKIDEHKCAHIIALDDGNYAAQPNNRCIWDIPSFTVEKITSQIGKCRHLSGRQHTLNGRTEDTDNFFTKLRRRNMKRSKIEKKLGAGE